MPVGKYILNGNDLYTVFGTVIESGSGSFLSYPERKPSVQNNWNDRDGLDIDLQSPKFNARNFRLRCVLMADSNEQFWERYNGLFTELAAMGTHQLYVYDLDRTFTMFYRRQDNVEKLSLLRADEIGVRFDLIFGETDWTDNIEKVYLVDHEGRYLIA